MMMIKSEYKVTIIILFVCLMQIMVSYFVSSKTSTEIPPYQPTDISGMVAYWPLDGNTNDKSINKLNGVEKKSRYDRGVIGQSLYIDNVKYRSIQIPNYSGDIGTSETINAWVKIDKDTDFGNDNTFFPIVAGNNKNKYNLSVSRHFVYFGCSNCSGGGVSNYPSIIPDGNWHLLSGIITNKHRKGDWMLYIDGVLVRKSRLTADINLKSIVSIGESLKDAKISAYVDEVSIYSRQLKKQEIEGLYQYGKDALIKNELKTQL